MPQKTNKLTDQQSLFIDELFKNNMNQTKAAKAAGFASGNAYTGRLMKKPQVQAEIARRQKILAEKNEVDAGWVIKRLMRSAQAGEILAKYTKIDEVGNLYYDFTQATEADLAVITGMTVEEYQEGRGEAARTVKKLKITTDSPKSALDSLARHLGLFKDKLEVSGEGSLVERLQRGRERVAKGKA